MSNNPSEANELLPCPFDNGEAVIDPHDNDTWCTITCKTCSAKTGGFSSIAEATQAWNTRAASPSTLELPREHGMPCYYCGELTDSLAGNPGKWPVILCHRDEPGVPKVHHSACVSARLDNAASPSAVRNIDENAFKSAWENWLVNFNGNKLDHDSCLRYAIKAYEKTKAAGKSAPPQSPYQDYTWEDIAMLVQENKLLKESAPIAAKE
jgi:hypothetical protein